MDETGTRAMVLRGFGCAAMGLSEQCDGLTELEKRGYRNNSEENRRELHNCFFGSSLHMLDLL